MRKRKMKILAFCMALLMMMGSTNVMAAQLNARAVEESSLADSEYVNGTPDQDTAWSEDASLAADSTEAFTEPEDVTLPLELEWNGRQAISSTEPVSALNQQQLRSSLQFNTNFYQQLTSLEQQYYNAMSAVDLSLYTNSNRFKQSVTPLTLEFTQAQIADNSYQYTTAFKDAANATILPMSRAFDAYTKDNPEIFWTDGFMWTVTGYTYPTSGRVVITGFEIYPTYYYSGILAERTQVNAALQTAVNTIKASVGGASDRYTITKAIHDYIANLMKYTSNSNLNAGWAHTITGPLLAAYNHEGVCEGYAKLFKILCDKFGVPSVIAVGASSGTSGVDHMWNYVQMESGFWYLVDVTWDDGTTIRYNYFLVGSQATTGSHYNYGIFSDFSSGETPYTAFTYPALSTITYNESKTLATQFVSRIYVNVLGRTPDTAGLNYWVSCLMNGTSTGAGIAVGFIFSQEYMSQNTSDSNYIDMLYLTLMNRNSDSGGKQYWLNYLNSGVTRKYIFAGFINSQEFKDLCNSYQIQAGTYISTEIVDQNPQVTAFVSRMYTDCLERSFEKGGLEYWTDQLLRKAVSGGDLAKNFFLSSEFTGKNHSHEKFVTLIYKTLLNRNADTSGLNYWVGQLNAGISRSSIIEGFIWSNEFEQLCASYGINR